MKTYSIKQSNIYIDDSETISYATSLHNLPHTYPAPYERNDRYILLRDEMDSRSKDVELEPLSGYMLYADFDFEYNYYAKEYEMGIPSISPEYLPDLNIWLLVDQQDEDGDGEPNYGISQAYMDRHGVMFSEFDVIRDPLSTDPDAQILAYETQPDLSLSKEYFESYVGSYNERFNAFVNPSSPFYKPSGLSGIYGTISEPEFINMTMSQIYSDANNKRENFPFYAKFKMCGVTKTPFCDILEESGMEKNFIDFLVMHRDENISDVTYEISAPEGHTKTTEISAQVPTYTLQGFYNHIADNHGSTTSSTTNSGNTDCEFFESFLQGVALTGKLDNFIATSGDMHIVPVAFRLVKHFIAPGESNFSEGFVKYFFNYSDLSDFKHYDTQVHYGGKYKYEVKVINAIVNPHVEYYDQSMNEYNYNMDPTIWFLEEPFYEEETIIVDSPPISPDVELLTYRGIDNKVLILLNQMIDQRLEVPVVINESDHNGNVRDFSGYDKDPSQLGVQLGLSEARLEIYGFQAQYLAQGIPMFDQNGNQNPIFFESDDPTDFELFKCTKHPVTYDDFRNEHYRFISSGDPRKLTAASYEDIIMPNQTYYYMFRAQDVHGNVSNPSPIYEFVLIKQGETLYPKIRIVDFAKPEPPIQKDKTFKKYLKIGFSPRQYQIPSDEVQNINDDLINGDIPIGITDDNLIGSDRAFKFRIRSKNTGKLLDINVRFKKNNVIKA